MVENQEDIKIYPSQSEFDKLRLSLSKIKAELVAIQSSKFWKVRKEWVKVKKVLGWEK